MHFYVIARSNRVVGLRRIIQIEPGSTLLLGNPALAPQLYWKEWWDFIFPHSTLVSLNRAGLLCSSWWWAGSWNRSNNPCRPIHSKWQTGFFLHRCSEGKWVFVVLMRGHPVLITLCLIPLSKSLFPLPAGSNWSWLTLSPSQAICLGKTIFLSLWIQLLQLINLTDEVSCTELTNSGMLLRINCSVSGYSALYT